MFVYGHSMHYLPKPTEEDDCHITVEDIQKFVMCGIYISTVAFSIFSKQLLLWKIILRYADFQKFTAYSKQAITERSIESIIHFERFPKIKNCCGQKLQELKVNTVLNIFEKMSLRFYFCFEENFFC